MLARDRILVVDDNESVRSILADALEYEGFRVSTATDGQCAWELVRRQPFAYDLVLTDMTMPAMDGIALLGKIMMDSPWIKVILMTAHQDVDLKIKAELLGAFTVLFKPLSSSSHSALNKSTKRSDARWHNESRPIEAVG